MTFSLKVRSITKILRSKNHNLIMDEHRTCSKRTQISYQKSIIQQENLKWDSLTLAWEWGLTKAS
jgi:hypothetical protein